jgi:hypothetical protein
LELVAQAALVEATKELLAVILCLAQLLLTVVEVVVEIMEAQLLILGVLVGAVEVAVEALLMVLLETRQAPHHHKEVMVVMVPVLGLFMVVGAAVELLLWALMGLVLQAGMVVQERPQASAEVR